MAVPKHTSQPDVPDSYPTQDTGGCLCQPHSRWFDLAMVCNLMDSCICRPWLGGIFRCSKHDSQSMILMAVPLRVYLVDSPSGVVLSNDSALLVCPVPLHHCTRCAYMDAVASAPAHRCASLHVCWSTMYPKRARVAISSAAHEQHVYAQ